MSNKSNKLEIAKYSFTLGICMGCVGLLVGSGDYLLAVGPAVFTAISIFFVFRSMKGSN